MASWHIQCYSVDQNTSVYRWKISTRVSTALLALFYCAVAIDTIWLGVSVIDEPVGKLSLIGGIYHGIVMGLTLADSVYKAVLIVAAAVYITIVGMMVAVSPPLEINQFILQTTIWFAILYMVGISYMIGSLIADRCVSSNPPKIDEREPILIVSTQV